MLDCNCNSGAATVSGVVGSRLAESHQRRRLVTRITADRYDSSAVLEREPDVREVIMRTESGFAQLLARYGISDAVWTNAHVHFRKGVLEQYDLVYEIGYGALLPDPTSYLQLLARASRVMRDERLYGAVEVNRKPGENPIRMVVTFRYNGENP